jgi:hypothetical protein
MKRRILCLDNKGGYFLHFELEAVGSVSPSDLVCCSAPIHAHELCCHRDGSHVYLGKDVPNIGRPLRESP